MSNFEVDHHEYTAADHNAVTRTKSLGDMEFVEILIRDIDGKPYYEIHYIENGEHHIGYSSYNIKIISEYLKEFFIK